MAAYVAGIQVQKAGVAEAGAVSPQIAAIYSHIKAELGMWLVFFFIYYCSITILIEWIRYIQPIQHHSHILQPVPNVSKGNVNI